MYVRTYVGVSQTVTLLQCLKPPLLPFDTIQSIKIVSDERVNRECNHN